MAGRPPKNGAVKAVSTELVLGRAAGQLSKAVVDLKAAFDEVNSLELKSEDLALKVANKEEEIANLETQFQEKKRQATLNLELQMKENSDKTIAENLILQGKVAVKREEYNSLLDELTQLKADFAQQIRAEIGKAEGMAKSRFESDLKLKEAEFKAKEAGNTAEIESLKKEVAFLNTQITKWETALVEERKAGVERAKASAIGSVNLGNDTGTGRR
jgi:hypothetical protein